MPKDLLSYSVGIQFGATIPWRQVNDWASRGSLAVSDSRLVCHAVTVGKENKSLIIHPALPKNITKNTPLYRCVFKNLVLVAGAGSTLRYCRRRMLGASTCACSWLSNQRPHSLRSLVAGSNQSESQIKTTSFEVAFIWLPLVDVLRTNYIDETIDMRKMSLFLQTVV